MGVDYFEFGYDTSVLHHRPDVVLAATFQLAPEDPERMRRIVEENLQWRRERHPPLDTEPSAGSIFKKIEGIGAGRLIDQCGLKGTRIGGAMVTRRHANIFINTGGATAADVRALIAHVPGGGRGADGVPAGGGDLARGGVLALYLRSVYTLTGGGSWQIEQSCSRAVAVKRCALPKEYPFSTTRRRSPSAARGAGSSWSRSREPGARISGLLSSAPDFPYPDEPPPVEPGPDSIEIPPGYQHLR